MRPRRDRTSTHGSPAVRPADDVDPAALVRVAEAHVRARLAGALSTVTFPDGTPRLLALPMPSSPTGDRAAESKTYLPPHETPLVVCRRETTGSLEDSARANRPILKHTALCCVAGRGQSHRRLALIQGLTPCLLFLQPVDCPRLFGLAFRGDARPRRPFPAHGGRARLGAPRRRRLAVRAEVGRVPRSAGERRRRARALVAQGAAAAALLPRAARARRAASSPLRARRRDRDRARRRPRVRPRCRCGCTRPRAAC